jgi:hypothetical protein
LLGLLLGAGMQIDIEVKAHLKTFAASLFWIFDSVVCWSWQHILKQICSDSFVRIPNVWNLLKSEWV